MLVIMPELQIIHVVITKNVLPAHIGVVKHVAMLPKVEIVPTLSVNA